MWWKDINTPTPTKVYYKYEVIWLHADLTYAGEFSWMFTKEALQERQDHSRLGGAFATIEGTIPAPHYERLLQFIESHKGIDKQTTKPMLGLIAQYRRSRSDITRLYRCPMSMNDDRCNEFMRLVQPMESFILRQNQPRIQECFAHMPPDIMSSRDYPYDNCE